MTKQIRIYLFPFLATLLAGLPAYGQVGSGIITMTTAKNIGEQIRLKITADGDFTIDGVEEQPEQGTKDYTIVGQIVIRGNVTELNCAYEDNYRSSYNRFTTLNASGCPTLKTLDCSKNQLTNLNVSGCTALTTLDCWWNELTMLDVSGCTALTKLSCNDNQLTALDASGCIALTELDCERNQLAALDVSGCTALNTLDCSSNKLTKLDVSKNAALTKLSCHNNQLKALDVSKNTALTELSCTSNKLTKLDVSKNAALTSLECYKNQLTALDVSGCTALTWLYCDTNKLTALDVSQNTALRWLECYDNQLTALDLSKNTALTMLYCNSNQLTALDASGCTALKTLDCNSNQLTALDVSGCTALTKLYCSLDQLTALDVSKNTALTDLDCSGNQIKGEEMTRLMNSLPDRTDTYAGYFVVIQSGTEGNRCLKTDVAIAKGKNWNTLKYDLDDKQVDAYEGEEPIPFAVTLTKEGEGMLKATGAADLNAVPEGTELTIVATPAAGYGLKSLTANGTDILANKKFTVTAATEVKATFTKKTVAEVVETGTLRLYPNPASAYVNVKGAKADALVRLYDANGTLRYEAHTDANGTLQIDLSAYAEGVYLLRVGDDAQRLLIQR